MFSFDMATYWKITIGLEGFSPTKVHHEFCPYCTSKWGDRSKKGNKRCWFNRIFGSDHELDCYKFCFCAFHCDCRYFLGWISISEIVFNKSVDYYSIFD